MLNLDLRQSAVNLLACAIAAAAAIALYLRKACAIRVTCASLTVAIVVMSALGIADVSQQVQPVLDQREVAAKDTPHATLSKNGKNEVAIMMDRAIGYYIPYLINEKPELLQSIQGFTYYLNAVSYGIFTNVGIPGLYGGYDYTPEAMNSRADTPISEKRQEALRVMPKLFMQNGFEAIFFDPTYAGYLFMPVLSSFSDIPNLHTCITMDGT